MTAPDYYGQILERVCKMGTKGVIYIAPNSGQVYMHVRTYSNMMRTLSSTHKNFTTSQ